MAHLKDNLASPVAPTLAPQVQPESPDPTVTRTPFPPYSAVTAHKGHWIGQAPGRGLAFCQRAVEAGMTLLPALPASAQDPGEAGAGARPRRKNHRHIPESALACISA